MDNVRIIGNVDESWSDDHESPFINVCESSSINEGSLFLSTCGLSMPGRERNCNNGETD